MKKDNLQSWMSLKILLHGTGMYRGGTKKRLLEQYLGRIVISCGGAESVQQAQAALCVRVGNMAA